MRVLIAIIIGALVGAAGDGPFGALVGALLGWLLADLARQRADIAALRERVAALAAAPTLPAAASPDIVPTALQQGLVVEDAVAAAPVSFDAASIVPRAAPAAEAAIAAHAEGVDTVPMDDAGEASRGLSPPARSADARSPLGQRLFGGNLVVKVGIGILFIGLAFLAKYAAEHTRVPPELRLAAIGAAGLALLVVGWRLRMARPAYAQVLQGGAVAVLYLTLFAAFRYYGVLGALPAFALMVVVAGLAAALAVLQDARSLAVVGALGGFATPLIVNTGSDRAAALFAYYFVLDLGIAAIAWSRTWRVLNVIGFVATFLVATAWGVLRYRSDAFAMSEGFLIAFFLLFVVVMLLPARRADAPASSGEAWVNGSLLFGLPTIVFALQYGLVRDTSLGTALSALALAAFYAGLAAWMRRRPALGITFDASLAIATVFLTLVIPFALDERSTAGAWTLEGAGLVWIGFRQQRWLPRCFGYLLHAFAALSMLLGLDRHGAPTLVFNAYLFNGVMAAAAAIASAWFIRRQRPLGPVAAAEQAGEPVLIGLATLWLAATAGLEIAAFVPPAFSLAATLAVASGIALVYALLAARLAWPTIAVPVALHAPLLLVAAAGDAVLLAAPWRDGGVWAWPVAFAVHLALLRLAAPHWPRPLALCGHALAVLALGLVGALTGRAATAGWGDAASAWPWLGWLVVPALLLIALPREATLRRWPMRTLPEAYVAAAGVIAVALGGWTLLANVASDGTASPLPYVPVLNPLDLGIAVALLGIVLWLRSAGQARRAGIVFVALAGFVWLNAMLVRGFHHYDGVPYRFDAWAGSLAVQTGITLLWATTALASMWLAAKRDLRTLWLAGALLLAAVVVKLLVVDLSGTVTRIVSFLGVGVLMLVIGYVAPPPAKEARHAPQ